MNEQEKTNHAMQLSVAGDFCKIVANATDAFNRIVQASADSAIAAQAVPPSGDVQSESEPDAEVMQPRFFRKDDGVGIDIRDRDGTQVGKRYLTFWGVWEKESHDAEEKHVAKILAYLNGQDQLEASPEVIPAEHPRTEDGVVMYIGMTVWTADVTKYKISVLGPEGCIERQCLTSHGFCLSSGLAEPCYSTEEAARAAGQQEEAE